MAWRILVGMAAAAAHSQYIRAVTFGTADRLSSHPRPTEPSRRLAYPRLAYPRLAYPRLAYPLHLCRRSVGTRCTRRDPTRAKETALATHSRSRPSRHAPLLVGA